MNRDAHLALRPVPASAASARRFVDEIFGGWGCDAFADAARLLVSELVTNAVLHARTDIEVRLRLTPQGVRVAVYDGSPATPTMRRYGDDAMTGRGLALLAELAHAWGVEQEPDGKAVWFELRQDGE